MSLLPYSKWLETSLGTRIKIAQQFGISKHRSTHVSNNVVIDDGYNIADVERVLDVNNLQTFLNSTETDIILLYSHLVDVMEGKVAIIMNTEDSVTPVPEVDSVPTAYEEPKKKVVKKTVKKVVKKVKKNGQKK